jgi:hypothetical protein
MYERGVLRSLIHREIEQGAAACRILCGNLAILAGLAQLASFRRGCRIITTVMTSHRLMIYARRLYRAVRMVHRARRR